MGIPGNAMGAAGYMLGMPCMECIAPGIAKPGEIAGMGVPPGPIIAYGIPGIICSQQCAHGQMIILQVAMRITA